MILRPDGGLFEKINFEIEVFALEKQWWNPAETVNWELRIQTKRKVSWLIDPNFHQFQQKWPVSDKKVNKKYFLKPKWCKKTLKSIFLQNSSVSHTFLTKSSVYKYICINFKKIYRCILQLMSLTLFRKVWSKSYLEHLHKSSLSSLITSLATVAPPVVLSGCNFV